MGILTACSGKLKDQASQMKLNMIHWSCTDENAKTIELATLKATSHTSNKPPEDEYVTFLQSTVDTSYSPETVAAILRRLSSTKNVCVAAKCFILIHKLIKSENGYNGECSLRDSTDLRTYLQLNDLRVNSRFTRELSPWVQWYKQYVDCYLSIAETLGVSLNMKYTLEDKVLEAKRVHFYTTDYIFKQINILVDLFEHMCDRPDVPTQNKIVVEMIELMVQDYISFMRLINIRFEELLSEGDIKLKELTRILNRIENCKEYLSEFFWRCKYLVEDFWSFVSNLKDNES